MSLRKVAFVDRDGTIIEEPEDFQVDRLDKVRFVEGVIPALLALQDDGYELVLVSNQDGLGTESFPTKDFEPPHHLMQQILTSQGIQFVAEHIDPSLPEAQSPNRKPGIGMLLDYLKRGDLDLARSVVIGDRDTDLELAENLGVPGHKLTADYGWPDILQVMRGRLRQASTERNTNETRIAVKVDLDSTQPISNQTGIGFFDHMLDQLASHGGFALTLECAGDLHIDEHHTVEDCALALGSALREALGDKRGIGRYGFVLPMDESLAQAAVDLSGRARFAFEADFPRDNVGELSTEMVEHFFHSLSDSLVCALHLKVTGENTHHMVEGLFKACGRALRQAFARDAGGALPSTKGVL
ncbi:MAG: bifunctional histidinol-phosphatase/imidazoleglycerol-phosphate dehydratase HisB [Pseudomonadota bacterium]